MGLYANSYYDTYWANYEAEVIKEANGGKVLEVVTETWFRYVDQTGLTPAELHCINISEAEMENGIKLSENSRIKSKFHIMDAHNMSFKDDTFDVVFGNGILHHLDLEMALIEIKRVLKPSGKIVFAEPLDLNPILIFIRLITPNARTIDEKAFRFEDLRIINKHFDLSYDYIQLMSVPLGLISSVFTKSPRNLLTKIGFEIDKLLAKLSGFGYLYRITLFKGISR